MTVEEKLNRLIRIMLRVVARCVPGYLGTRMAQELNDLLKGETI